MSSWNYHFYFSRFIRISFYATLIINYTFISGHNSSSKDTMLNELIVTGGIQCTDHQIMVMSLHSSNTT